jgi:hypothetical protein
VSRMTWRPGETVVWAYRPTDGGPGIEAARAVHVVADEPDQLVVWLAPGSQVLRPVAPDGRDLRSLPVADRFGARGRRRDTWWGQGVLKVAPAGVPWSVWLFYRPGWRLAGWYVNLEEVHRRAPWGTLSRDLVLDVWVGPDRRAHRKDEDELAAAVAAGALTPAEAAAAERSAAEVEDRVRAWAPPFDAGWERWRPDPSWAPASLPDPLPDAAGH